MAKPLTEAATSEQKPQDEEVDWEVTNPWTMEADEAPESSLEAEDDEEEPEGDADPEGDAPEVKPESETPAPEPELTGHDIDKLLAKYGNDPRQVAKALANLEKLQSRQATELGELRKRTGAGSIDAPASGGEILPTPPGESSPEVDLPLAKLPGDEYGNVSYDPKLPHDEESGWPLDPDGHPVMPVDAWGVPFIPRRRWEKRAAELEVETGSPTVAMMRLQEEQQAAEQEFWRKSREAFVTIRQAQFEYMEKVAEPRLVKQIAHMYGADLAPSLARYLMIAVAKTYDEATTKGSVPRADLKSRAAIDQLISGSISHLITTGKMQEEVDKIRAQMKKESPAPEKKEAAPPKTKVRVSPLSPPKASVSAPTPQAQGAGTGRPRAVRAGLMTQEEWDQYSKKDFTFS